VVGAGCGVDILVLEVRGSRSLGAAGGDSVKTHVKNVLAKLSFRSRWQITAMVGEPNLMAGA